ncbi:MAG: YebC/PmpR family DNA-binding transcriptional regulator [Gammaproteobacteria bacterium]|nr:YebC/PmpR family DNA-binding transcriptional regulator [Gammaproteobacteria bacterium]
MAGHSKWANIQHRKGRQDAKRGKLFSKLIREITVSARLSGPDPDGNPRLRAAVDNALAGNMPKDTIERAIKRGAGGAEGESLEEVRYEGYGPGGVAVMVDCMTDNRNRTVAEVRHTFSKCGGNLGTDGSVAYLFTKVGLLSYPSGVDEEALLEAALEAGAEDVAGNDDGSQDVLTTPEQFLDVKDSLADAGYPPETAEVTMRAATGPALDLHGAQTMIRLLETLEDLNDVQKVYSNAEIADDILAQLD